VALTNASFIMSAGYTLQTVTAFGTDTLGPGSLSLLPSPIPVTWNSLFLKSYTIANSGTQDFDLSTFNDLQGQAAGMAHVFAIVVIPLGGAVKLSPGGSNALQWFFSGNTTATYITVPASVANQGGFGLCNPIDATGQVVSSGAGTLRLTNNSGVGVTVTVLAFGSTT
jgi:hypothetical protein